MFQICFCFDGVHAALRLVGIKGRESKAVELQGLNVGYLPTTYTGGAGLGDHHEQK